MSGTSFGSVELDTTDYRNFLLGATSTGFILPSRKDTIYVANELPAFFERARQELENLLGQVHPEDSPVIISDVEEIVHEFHLLGHGKTGTNKDGKLTGWAGDMPTHTYQKGGKAQLGGIELALAQAGIMPDDETSIALVSNVPRINIDDYAIRFSGDLPRQIAHTLLLTGNQDLENKVYEISEKVDSEIQSHGKIYDAGIYHELMGLAIDAGFIPTPLLRAQYYGPMEMGPEKLKEEDRVQFIDTQLKIAYSEFEKAKKQGRILKSSVFNEDKVRHEIKELADAMIQRKNLLFAHNDENGHYLTENRFDLAKRLEQFYSTVMKATYDKSTNNVISGPILAVTSSGCIDVSPSIFRYFCNTSKMHIETPKKKVRGKVLEAKIGTFNSKKLYLNDAQSFRLLTDELNTIIARRRGHSFDELVKRGEGIVSTPLAYLEKDTTKDEYIKNSIGLDDILDYANEPLLVLADGGHGKSILSTEIVSRINERIESGGKKVGIFAHCEDIQHFTRDPSDVQEYLESLIGDLPQTLTESYEFVYVIDGLEALGNAYRASVISAVGNITNKKKNHMILTSRYIGFAKEEDGNRGFRTLFIDTDRIAENPDMYLEGRLERDRHEEFKEWAQKLGKTINGSFQQLYFALELYKSPEDVLEYLTNQTVVDAIKERRPLNKEQITDSAHDLILGRYITSKPEYARFKGEPDKIREIVIATKRHMDELAFTELTGKEAYHLNSIKK